MAASCSSSSSPVFRVAGGGEFGRQGFHPFAAEIALVLGILVTTGKGQAVTAFTFGSLAQLDLVEDGLYHGNLRRGKPHGRGHIQYFTDDPLGRYNYSGLWVKGKREDPDAGETHFRDGSIYTGGYANDKEEGRGKKSHQDGSQFSGFFSEGLRQGSGTLTLPDDSRRVGNWKQDKLEGLAFYHAKPSKSGNGNTEEDTKVERWRKGRRIGDGASETAVTSLSTGGSIPEANLIPDNASSGGKGTSTLSPPPPPLLPGNFTRGAKKLNGDGGADKAEGGGGGDNDADVTYFSPAKDVYEGDVIATRVAEEVRREEVSTLKRVHNAVHSSAGNVT